MQDSKATLEKTFEESDDFVEKLKAIIDVVRPVNGDIEQVESNMYLVTSFFASNPKWSEQFSEDLTSWFLTSKISYHVALLGIYAKDGLWREVTERLYQKFLPNPPEKSDLGYLLETIFWDKNDAAWVCQIKQEQWQRFFRTLVCKDVNFTAMKNYLYSALLYAAEIVAVWIASEEFNRDFIRLDNSILNHDSPFLALQREVSAFTKQIEAETTDIEKINLDFKHLFVLLEQCYKQIERLKKKSIFQGISVSLTYQLERLEQILERLELILNAIKRFDTIPFYDTVIQFIKENLRKNATKNSIRFIIKNNIKILSRSVTNNTSEHGEHYIATNKKDYLKMLFSASGAGVVIAFMAWFKIMILQVGFEPLYETIFSSLNYGLGFVLIHILGFTIATKQPAMTASTFAQAIEKGAEKRANQHKLVLLIMQVIRSQLAAVVGNVTLALVVGFLIVYALGLFGVTLLDVSQAEYYIQSVEPISALFYATIAGVWLFCAGLIAGYFDNRANFLNIKQRYIHQPLLKKLLPLEVRTFFATYVHDNYGAIAGNFFFGVLLGVTPFIGYLLGLPLDIRHIAFSTANVAFGSYYLPFDLTSFLLAMVFVLLIGLVNLAVSFFLALKISLQARDAYFGNVATFMKLLLKEIIKNPKDLILPPKEQQQEEDMQKS
ncbi:MAG TPA: recombinase [Epsilonproteobacteria bacterium]|nr:recombinase [Campylobacterota bacterium]